MMTSETPAEAGRKGVRVRPSSAQPLGVLAVDGGMLTIETVSQLCGLGKSTIRKMVKRGDFPEPVRVTARAVRWRAEDIRLWLKRHGAL